MFSGYKLNAANFFCFWYENSIFPFRESIPYSSEISRREKQTFFDLDKHHPSLLSYFIKGMSVYCLCIKYDDAKASLHLIMSVRHNLLSSSGLVQVWSRLKLKDLDLGYTPYLVWYPKPTHRQTFLRL